MRPKRALSMAARRRACQKARPRLEPAMLILTRETSIDRHLKRQGDDPMAGWGDDHICHHCPHLIAEKAGGAMLIQPAGDIIPRPLRRAQRNTAAHQQQAVAQKIGLLVGRGEHAIGQRAARAVVFGKPCGPVVKACGRDDKARALGPCCDKPLIIGRLGVKARPNQMDDARQGGVFCQLRGRGWLFIITKRRHHRPRAQEIISPA